MKIRTIILSDIESMKYGITSFDLKGNLTRDVERAMGFEHRGTCDNSCDICAAMENGFPLVAAFLLRGATETELLDRVMQAHAFDGSVDVGEPFNAHDDRNSAPTGWADWCAFHAENSVTCDACGSNVYTMTTTRCGNCLCEVTARTDGAD